MSSFWTAVEFWRKAGAGLVVSEDEGEEEEPCAPPLEGDSLSPEEGDNRL